MNLHELGYQAALVDMGFVKQAALPAALPFLGKAVSAGKGLLAGAKNFFTGAGSAAKAPIPKSPFPVSPGAAKPPMGKVVSPPTPKGPTPARGSAATPPPGAAGSAGATTPPPGAAGSGGAPTPPPKPGLLQNIRNKPVRSTLMAGAGGGGLGYVMGAGSQPPSQPNQLYGPGMGYQ